MFYMISWTLSSALLCMSNFLALPAVVTYNHVNVTWLDRRRSSPRLDSAEIGYRFAFSYKNNPPFVSESLELLAGFA